PSAGQSQYLRPASPRTCRRQRMDRPVTLDSERFSANVSATLFTDTDVTLSGDYYVYQQNPAQVGFFTLVAAGRGAGVPIAPLRYEVRPEVVHRFGDLSARLWVQAGEYVPGTG